MLKKTITYVDFNDQEITEDFFFNLSEAEISDWQYSNEDGLTMSEYMQKIYETKNANKLYKLMKHLILMTYGEKSADGKHFRKSPEITSDFECSAAYPVLFSELMSDADKASEFIKACLPKSMVKHMPSTVEEAKKLIAEQRGKN